MMTYFRVVDSKRDTTWYSSPCCGGKRLENPFCYSTRRAKTYERVFGMILYIVPERAFLVLGGFSKVNGTFAD